MPAKPADNEEGTWGDTLNAWVGTSLSLTTGKILDGALMESDAAPTEDAGVANKKYVDTGAWTPSAAYSGEQSITFPNGLITKFGNSGSIAGGATKTVTYSSAFPNGFVACFGSIHTSAGIVNDSEMITRPKSGSATTVLEIVNGDNTTAQSLYWIAIGY